MGSGEGVKTKMKSQKTEKNKCFICSTENLCSTDPVGMFVCLFVYNVSITTAILKVDTIDMILSNKSSVKVKIGPKVPPVPMGL